MKSLRATLVSLTISLLLLSPARADSGEEGEQLQDATVDAPQSKAAYLDGQLRAAKIAWEKTLAERAAAEKLAAEKAAADKLAAEKAAAAQGPRAPANGG
jgi:hypothetical protein